MRNRGQAAAALVVVTAALFVAMAAAAEAGNFIYHKMHMQNVADSGAMEGGLWYARALNFLSLSNKVVAAGYAASLFFPPALKAADAIRRAQGALVDDRAQASAALLICAAVTANGKKNKAASAAFLNTEEEKPGGFLSLNVRRYSVSSSTARSEVYYYNDALLGKVYLERSQVFFDQKARRWRLKKGIVVNGKQSIFVIRRVEYVRPEGIADAESALLVEETGPHTLLALSRAGYKPLFPGLFLGKRKEIVITTASMVRVAGGSMALEDLEGASYEPRFEKIIVPRAIKLLGGSAVENVILH